MKPEIEAKFLDVDHDALRRRLTSIGAVCSNPMRLMKRKNFDFPDGRLNKVSGWARLRDEGGKVTLAYKQLNDRSLHGTHEVSVTVGSFEPAEEFLKAIGLELTTYQETKCESWRFEDFEIELDEWPWVKPYIEMEGPDEQALKRLAEKLDLDWAQVCHGSVEVVYRGEYDATDDEINSIPVITFEESIPDWLQKRRKP